MSFVPKDAMAFEEALERAGVARRVALRQELFAGNCRSGVADPRSGTVDLPAPWWGVEKNWTEAVASGNGEYRLFKWFLGRPTGSYQYNPKTGHVELVPAAPIIYRGPIFVLASDLNRLLSPPAIETSAPEATPSPLPDEGCDVELLKKLESWFVGTYIPERKKKGRPLPLTSRMKRDTEWEAAKAACDDTSVTQASLKALRKKHFPEHFPEWYKGGAPPKN